MKIIVKFEKDITDWGDDNFLGNMSDAEIIDYVWDDVGVGDLLEDKSQLKIERI